MGTTGVAWPADAVAGVPSFTGRLTREGLAPLLVGATAARPFGAISGVRPGTANPITTTSTTWSCGLFGGVIDLEASNLSGPYTFMFNVATSGVVTASNATNPRIDTLSVQISDPAEGDLTAAPLVTLVYNTGLAAPSPVDPVTPVARAFIVARLNFSAGVGTVPTVTWAPPYTVASGGILPTPTTVYPASPYLGQYVDDAVLGLLRWNGTIWAPVGAANIVGLTVAAGSGTISVAANSKVTLTGVGTSFTLANFPTTYNKHVVTVDLVSSVACTLTAQFTDAAGTTVAVTAYDTQFTFSDGPASVSSSQTLNAASLKTNMYASATRRRITLDLSQLAVAAPTLGDMKLADTVVGGGAAITGSGLVYHRTAAAYAGVKFTLSAGTVTGVAYVEVGQPL